MCYCKESASHKKAPVMQSFLHNRGFLCEALRIKSPGYAENSAWPGPIRMIPQSAYPLSCRTPAYFMFFFHPDCTVGIGISPIQPRCHHRRSRTGMSPYITASRELHPTPKTHLMHHSITLQTMFGKPFFCFPLPEASPADYSLKSNLWNKCLQFGQLLFIIEGSQTRENTERVLQI